MALPATMSQKKAEELLLQKGCVPLPSKKMSVEGVNQPIYHPFEHPGLKMFVQFTSSIETYMSGGRSMRGRRVYKSVMVQILDSLR